MKSRWLVAIIVVAAIIPSLALAAIMSVSLSQANENRAYEDCRRQNVNKSWERRYEVISPAPPDYQIITASVIHPILDCRKTAERDGRPVALDDGVQVDYIRIVILEKEKPIVRDGEIVGTEQFVEQERDDFAFLMPS